MEVIRHGNLTVERFINSFYASNSYLLIPFDSHEAWLIDCGDIPPLLKNLERRSLSVQGVFLTHTHYDHIYGLNELKDRFPHLSVYTNIEGCESLHTPKYNFSKYHGIDFRYMADDVRILTDGESVALSPTCVLTAFATPGHDWSCQTFRVGDFLFTGDAFIPGLKTVTMFPKSNRLQAACSLERILTLTIPRSIVCPGHGPVK